MASLMVRAIALWFLVSIFSGVYTEAQDIGVNYGLQGDNLPPPSQVIALCKSRNIQKLRIFSPDHDVLDAVKDSGIQLIIGTLNQDLVSLATDPSAATAWVQTNILPYASSIVFRYISAGNEVIPGDLSDKVLPAIKNLNAALHAAGLNISVTTAIATSVLGVSYPPSAGVFSPSAAPTMNDIVAYLQSVNAPLLVNVYPYLAYAGDTVNVGLDYSLFTAEQAVVTDGTLQYRNLFDAIVDAVYSATEKAGAEGIKVVVSETGWPSAGGIGATVENAMEYNNNVVAHVMAGGGTPRRPGNAMEAYLFAIFNEDLKPAGVEQNWGLFRPDMSEVYNVTFP